MLEFDDHSSDTDDDRAMIDRARVQAQACKLRRQSSLENRMGGDEARLDAFTDVIPGYQLIEEVHRGGQGVVFRGVQLSTERSVAIKVLA